MSTRHTLLTVAMTALAFVVNTLTALAEPIDQQTARQRAAAFLNSNTAMHRKRAVKPATLAPVELRTSLYAFNIGDREGFVVVSPDDQTESILAYSTTGQLDSETMPDNMRAWFQEYANQLDYIQAHPTPARSPRRVGSGTATAFDDVTITAKNPIDPLLTTMWNQTNPYNLRCPIYFTDERCVTGCVATAMSQVMNYHQWPDSTIAQIPAYDCQATFLGTLHIDSIPAGLHLDWENMTDIFQGDESEEHLTAISDLMFATGASVRMNYKDIANGGSGALLMDVPGALQAYFDYSPAMHYEVRGNYTIDVWEQLVYNELKAKRPVIYQGSSSGGGHAFVVDGYSEGFFHINWGWGNDNSTVLCRLSVLAPGNNIGAGASTSLDGYSFDQAAVFNLRPRAEEDEPYVYPYKDLYLTSGITGVAEDQIFCMFANNTSTTASFNFGIGYLDEEGDYIPVRVASPREFPASTKLLTPVPFSVSGLSPGTYRIVPISKLNGQYIWHSSQNPNVDYVEAVVDDDGITLTRRTDMKATIAVDGTHLINDPHTININITNSGEEFYGRIFLHAYRVSTQKSFDVGAAGITIRKGESKTTGLQFTDVVPDTIARDTIIFTVTMAEDEEAPIIAQRQVIFSTPPPDPVKTDKITLLTKLTNESLTADSAYILGTSPKIRVKITNPTDSDYVGSIRYKLFKFRNKRMVGTHSKGATYNIKNHTTDEFDLTLFDGQFQIGTAYSMVLAVQQDGKLPNPTTAPDSGKIVMPPVFMYRADGYSLAEISRDTLVVPARAALVDLREAVNTKVVKGGNPNTFYVLNEGTAPVGVSRNIIRNGQADTISLEDGYNFYLPEDVKAKHVRYTRAFRRGYQADRGSGWNTMMLPFDVQKVQVRDSEQTLDWQHSEDDHNKDFWLMEFDHQDGAALVFKTADRFVANRPYLVAVPQSGYIHEDLTRLPITFSADDVTLMADAASATTGINYQMRGIRYFQDLDSIFALDGTGHQFELRDTTIQSFRAYFAIRNMDAYDYTVDKLDVIIPFVPDVPSVFLYEANGNFQTEIATDTLKVSPEVAAVDLREAINIKVVSGGNPNTLYFLDKTGAVPKGVTLNFIRGGKADNITLEDGHDLYLLDKFTANHVSYTRSFDHLYRADTQEGWNTLMLPFNVKKIQVRDGDELRNVDWERDTADVNGDFWLWEYSHQDDSSLVFKPASSIVGNQPYLVAVSQSLVGEGPDILNLPVIFSADTVTVEAKAPVGSDDTYQMCGTLSTQNLESIFTLDDTGSRFELGDAVVSPFRAYLAILDAETYDTSKDKLAIRLHLPQDNSAHIPDIIRQSTRGGDAWYTPAGQRVVTPNRKGIFIHKGRKYVIQ